VKVGDLIRSRTRYYGQKFLVIGIRDIGLEYEQVRAIRMPDGFKTRWSNIETWEVISASR
jgi:hypothetical protein